jgi:hypothetical protein
MHNRTLYILIAAAVVLSLGHHVDHAIRGNHVGWPLTDEVNAFTYSLGIYPAIAVGLLLTLTGRVGAGFWAFLSGGGALFLSYIHFGPQAIEPPADIFGPYESPIAGSIAFGWLLALVGVLAVTFVYELRLWHRGRRDRRGAVDATADG